MKLSHMTEDTMNFSTGMDQLSTDFNLSNRFDYNTTAANLPLLYALDYRIIATIIQLLVFLFGVTGNIIVIIVIFRTRSLHSPTYTYLISLAVADLIVLMSAVPEAIVVHHIGRRWLLGQIGCSVFIFVTFLGINAGSLSILAFTVEQYVSICGRSTWKIWLTSHTDILVGALWIFAVVYCSPWLGLTEVRPDKEQPFYDQCEQRELPEKLYLGLFGLDLCLFYVIPLVTALICYTKIAITLLRNTRFCSWDSPARSGSLTDGTFLPIIDKSTSSFLPHAVKPMTVFQCQWARTPKHATPQSRKEVLRMLVIIVVLFAIAWLPFRALLVYNSLAATPWMDVWYFFFAKTLIYFNSAINPFLYTIMSNRFRIAFCRIVFCKNKAASSRRTKGSRNSTNSKSQHDPFLI